MTDTIDVNRNKRGFIESVYRRYASTSDVWTMDGPWSKKKKEKGGKDPTKREGDTIEETMKIVDRRENDRQEVFYLLI